MEDCYKIMIKIKLLLLIKQFNLEVKALHHCVLLSALLSVVSKTGVGIILLRNSNTRQQVSQWTRWLSFMTSLDLNNGFHCLKRRTMLLHLIFKTLCHTSLKKPS